jgi:hypothetical protein
MIRFTKNLLVSDPSEQKDFGHLAEAQTRTVFVVHSTALVDFLTTFARVTDGNKWPPQKFR